MAKNRNTKPATPAQAAQGAAQGTQQAPATTANAAPVNAALAVVYTAGKPYNVRNGTAQDNARSWSAVQEVLQANNGQATMGQLQAAVAPFNHVPFVQYAIRRGWLAPVASTQAA